MESSGKGLIRGPRGAILAIFWHLTAGLIAFFAIGVEFDRQGRSSLRIAKEVPDFFQSDSLENKVRDALGHGNAAAGASLARTLLKRRPISAESLSLYGSGLLASGMENDGTAALQLAAGRGWRDLFVQRLVALSALQQGSSEIAANRVVAMWRIGARDDWLKHLTTDLIKSPDGLLAFKRTLRRTDIHLSTDVLMWAIDELPAGTVSQLTKSFAEMPSTFDCHKLSDRVDGLTLAGKIRSAAVVWGNFCQRGVFTSMTDLKFRVDGPDFGPFDWRYPEKAGVDVQALQNKNGGTLRYISSDPMLQVIARRYFTFAAGKHRLGVGRPGLPNDINVEISCIGKYSNAKIDIQYVRPQLSFVIPEGCPVQELRLSTRSGSGEVGSFY